MGTPAIRTRRRARGYGKKLLENAKVVKYLAAKHADLLTEFQRVQEAAVEG